MMATGTWSVAFVNWSNESLQQKDLDEHLQNKEVSLAAAGRIGRAFFRILNFYELNWNKINNYMNGYKWTYHELTDYDYNEIWRDPVLSDRQQIEAKGSGRTALRRLNLMIGREPKNERQRRAEAKARVDLENPPSPNVEIIAMENGSVMIRELDNAGNLIWETFGIIEGGSGTMAAAEHLVLIEDIANLKEDMKRIEDKIDAPGEESTEKLLSEIDLLKIRLFDIERRAINQ
jgi:hypothetical protein